MLPKGFEHFNTHPAPGSLVVSVVQEKTMSTKGMLKDEDTKKLDLFCYKHIHLPSSNFVSQTARPF